MRASKRGPERRGKTAATYFEARAVEIIQELRDGRFRQASSQDSDSESNSSA